MKENGWSRADVAQRTDRSVSTVARWLRDGLEGADLFLLSTALNVSAQYMLGLRDTPERAVFLRPDQRELLGRYEALPGPERQMVMDAFKDAKRALQKARAR